MDSRTVDSITPELSRTRGASSTLVKVPSNEGKMGAALKSFKSGFSLAGDRAAAAWPGQPEPLKPTMRHQGEPGPRRTFLYKLAKGSLWV